MFTNPSVGGVTTTTNRPTTATITSSLSGRTRRTPSSTAHRTERLCVDFAIPTTSVITTPIIPPTTTKMDSETMAVPRSEGQSFSRMPSQRRRRLWTLAARAAARREHSSQDKEATVLSSGSQASKHIGESSTQSSSFLKPGTVRTQDSGISSMDYLTSREANSPNSEEAGFRQRASLSLTGAEHQPGVFRQPLQPPGPRWPQARVTKIVVSGEAPMVRYANYCNAYVPEWVRRNWSSAPRPLISRQRSSMEVSYDIAPDWAASMETLNMQQALYPQNRRLFYGRYGRASCPKATTFFEHHFPSIHMEEENIEEEVEEKPQPVKMPSTEEHLRRRRFNAPCWCEHHPMPLPTYHTPTSMLSPYFHCSACPYRCLEHTGLVPIHHTPQQSDLGQRHIRRRRLKRMSSEPTPPTWMSGEEGEGLLAPAKRRPPPPEPLSAVTSPPPIPIKVFPTPPQRPQQQSSFPPVSPPSELMYSEPRIITSTPRTDVYLMVSEGTPKGWRRRRGTNEGLIRGRSVDEVFYSPRWERQPSFLSDPRKPTYIYEEEVKDWGPPYSHYSRLEENPMASSGLIHHQFYQPPLKGVPYGIRPGSSRSLRTDSSAWYPTSPRYAPILRPRSVSGSRPGHCYSVRPLRGHVRRVVGPGIPGVRSAASSLESSDAATGGTAPPWQLTSPPLSSTSRHQNVATARRKISQGNEIGVSGSGDSADSTMLGRRKRKHLHAMPRNVDTAEAARGLDVKWKRKSFKRSNGYDAADVIDRTPSTYMEQIEFQPLRHEPTQSVQAGGIRTTTTVVHESREEDEEEGRGDDESRRSNLLKDSAPLITTPLMASSSTTSRDLEAGTHKSDTPIDNVDGSAESANERKLDENGEEDDIDKVVVMVSRPRSATSSSAQGVRESGTLLRALKTPLQEILIKGTSSSDNELVILGFTNCNDYWEHSAFGRSRVTAILIAFIAISCLLYCLVSATWVYSGIPGNVTQRGLWRKCSVINTTCELTIPFISESDGWQGAATCILLVAIFIGLLGTGLAIFGHSGSDLVKRLYYFHSSGEIFFLAGFITFLTFGIYRSYANLNLLSPRQTSPTQPTTTQDPHHSLSTNCTSSPISSATTTLDPQLLWQVYYGSADIVGWCGGILFMAAAVGLLMKGVDDEEGGGGWGGEDTPSNLKASKLKVYSSLQFT
nr:hypothetical transcript [Hymenolepis microstoma]